MPFNKSTDISVSGFDLSPENSSKWVVRHLEGDGHEAEPVHE